MFKLKAWKFLRKQENKWHKTTINDIQSNADLAGSLVHHGWKNITSWFAMLHGAFISSLFRNILHPIWHLQLYIGVGDLPQIESGFCSIGPVKKVIAIVGVPRWHHGPRNLCSNLGKKTHFSPVWKGRAWSGHWSFAGPVTGFRLRYGVFNGPTPRRKNVFIRKPACTDHIGSCRNLD